MTFRAEIGVWAGALLLVAACAPGQVRVSRAPDAPLDGPRDVVLLGERGPVELALEDHLRAAGFRVKRRVERAEITEATPGRQETRVAPLTRFALELRHRVRARCVTGGFDFEELRVELVDLHENEVVARLEGSGMSEGCGTLFSGPVFGAIVEQLRTAWPDDAGSRRAAAPAPR